MKKRFLLLIFSFLLGASLFILVVQSVGWQAIKEVFFVINTQQILMLFLLSLLVPLIEGLRWREILKVEIKKISFKISNLLINYFPKLKGNIKKLSLLISTKYLNIDKIFPLLVDPYVEEIFYDSQKDNFYINHQKFGRCNTNLNLSDVEVEALITHLRFESKKRLDFNHPSLIHVINNEYFHCRFSIDIYPSHWKDFSFDIRKLNKKTFTLFNLISLNTMNKDMVNFLIFCVLFKINITIAGEVNSGKTTLLNSIDLVIPKNFRKIYVEETIESLEIPSKYGHQLKYHVKSQYQEENSQKNQEIYKLLHRSGDIIILGEILNKSETKALFHCLSAGLNGMQTTHASNLDSLINRWIIHFKINQNCLNDLGIVIFMKKIGLNRKILSINEIYYNKNEEKIEYHQIYKYFPKSDDWKSDYLFQDTKLFKKINEFLNLSLEKFQNILNVIDENTSEKLSINSPSKQFIYNPINEIYSKLKKIDKNLGEL